MPVWHSGLTKRQSAQIEKVQKTAFKIMLDNSYTNYEAGCNLLNLEPLYIRRNLLCLTFAKKDLKKENTIFSRVTTQSRTRATAKQFYEYKSRTRKHQNSSLSYLSRLLNTHS